MYILPSSPFTYTTSHLGPYLLPGHLTLHYVPYISSPFTNYTMSHLGPPLLPIDLHYVPLRSSPTPHSPTLCPT